MIFTNFNPNSKKNLLRKSFISSHTLKDLIVNKGFAESHVSQVKLSP